MTNNPSTADLPDRAGGSVPLGPARSLVETMPRRLQEVIGKAGNIIKYYRQRTSTQQSALFRANIVSKRD